MLSVKTKVFENNPTNGKLVQKMAYYSRQGINAMDDALKVEGISNCQKTQAFFIKAELYRKFFTPSSEDQMRNSEKAIEAFEMVVKLHAKGQEKLVDKSKDAKDMLERQIKTHKKSMEPLEHQINVQQ